jgi:hypothetical protein
MPFCSFVQAHRPPVQNESSRAVLPSGLFPSLTKSVPCPPKSSASAPHRAPRSEPNLVGGTGPLLLHSAVGPADRVRFDSLMHAERTSELFPGQLCELTAHVELMSQRPAAPREREQRFEGLHSAARSVAESRQAVGLSCRDPVYRPAQIRAPAQHALSIRVSQPGPPAQGSADPVDSPLVALLRQATSPAADRREASIRGLPPAASR